MTLVDKVDTHTASAGASDAQVLAEVAEALERVRRGDVKVRLQRRAGLAGEVVDGLNDVIARQERQLLDLMRISRVVGREGRLTERLDEEGFDGAWADGVRAVNSLIDDLGRPATEIARVIAAVAEGDLSQHMADEIEGRPLRGEFLRIGRTVNTMVGQLSSFADEVTRVAREVGTEGKLGGQADVRGVAGTWRDLTDSVNTMASNLTSQVRSISSVSTAVAKGDLSQKITVDAQGEILELKSTVNTMVDQLSSFADEVTRVAREVGTEGKLGGQAQVKGVSGTWRDLTENVNQLASTLTTQLRAIAQVSTSVTRGDLTQRITVRAQGEVAELKDNINQMIVTLRETTKTNAEQGWLDSNLARIGGLLQGLRDVDDVCRLIMSEVTPLADAQLGAFFLPSDFLGSDTESTMDGRLRLTASYGYAPESEVSFARGVGLVGQAAAGKRRIRVRPDRTSDLIIATGLVDARPADLVVYPVLFEGETLGVIEFASVVQLPELHLAFLDRLVPTIGVALKTIQANRRTEALLSQSQRLARELQDQSAELQRTNAELEEKAALLSEQKENIELQNREIELARANLEEKAQQLAQASQYKSEFLANISHELRTPLNSMLVLSRLLSDNPDANLTARQTEFARTIHNAGSDLLGLIDDILDLSKIEAGRMDVEPGEISFGELRDFVTAAFGVQAEQKGLRLQVNLADGLPPTLVTDAQRLQQVLRNLIANAVKFTNAGSVTVTVADAEPGPQHGVPTLDSAARLFAFTVTDTGVGIAADKLSLIFEAFQQADGTTSRRFGGTGLGLSISRQLARLLGGTISVESTVGAGSVFTLLLPDLAELSELDVAAGVPWPAAGQLPAVPQVGPFAGVRSRGALPSRRNPIIVGETVASDAAKRLRGATVLVVDDDVRNVFALTSALEMHGMTVLYADNGADGIRMLTEQAGIDIVLMDAMMPEMDGNQTTREIRRSPRFATLPIIFLTAKAMPGDRESSLAAGATDYVTKPVDLDDLLTLMARTVAGVAP